MSAPYLWETTPDPTIRHHAAPTEAEKLTARLLRGVLGKNAIIHRKHLYLPVVRWLLRRMPKLRCIETSARRWHLYAYTATVTMRGVAALPFSPLEGWAQIALDGRYHNDPAPEAVMLAVRRLGVPDAILRAQKPPAIPSFAAGIPMVPMNIDKHLPYALAAERGGRAVIRRASIEATERYAAAHLHGRGGDRVAAAQIVAAVWRMASPILCDPATCSDDDLLSAIGNAVDADDIEGADDPPETRAARAEICWWREQVFQLYPSEKIALLRAAVANNPNPRN